MSIRDIVTSIIVRAQRTGFSRLSFLLLGFIIILSLPTIDQTFKISHRFFPSHEFRYLSPYPDAPLSDPQKFVAQFDDYYNDHFGLRNLLFRGFSFLKYRILKVSPLPDKVVVGKDGWLFAGNEWRSVIDETMGNIIFSESELVEIAERVQRLRAYYDSQGIAFYVMVVPNKHTIYSEYLPSYITNPSGMTKLDQVTSYLRETIAFDIIDLRDVFMKAKSEYLLYYKDDTHWNSLGTYLGYQYLARRIKQDFPQLRLLGDDETGLTRTRNQIGDLMRMMNLSAFRDSDNHFFLEPFCEKLPAEEPVPPPDYYQDPEHYAEKYACSTAYKLKLQMHRDSFTSTLLYLLRHSFSESLYIWDYHNHVELAQQEHPDIVLIQIAERAIEELLELSL